MCGIVGAIARYNIVPHLIEGLRRLEYRGYDSAGIAVITPQGLLKRLRLPGKVQTLAEALSSAPLEGTLGIAHTRWATHGPPSEQNAHPHICCNEIAVVHNGIIENHEALRLAQTARGYRFTSQTDTEVIAHQIHWHLKQGLGLPEAVRAATRELKGAFALGVISIHEPQRLIAARRGSPLVIGLAGEAHFIASDIAALLPITHRFIHLEDGDIADITLEGVAVRDGEGLPVHRPERLTDLAPNAVERGQYRHYMLKEIHEQPNAIAETLEGRIAQGRVLEAAFGPEAKAVFDKTRAVHIIACGTSYHAGLVARNWFEGLAGIPCRVEVASEFRYRHPVVDPDTLFVFISQSGETADTLAALRKVKEGDIAFTGAPPGGKSTLAICNVPESSLVREADLTLMTRAGPEIGVASTKAFTTQLVALLLLVTALGRRHRLSPGRERVIVEQLAALPRQLEAILTLEGDIQDLATRFADKHHALFLGRGVQHPIAMEGALKLKEISYIHAEAYPAGELKHGPLALIDAEMPVIAVAPHDALLEKLKSNLAEVKARGGQLYVFADRNAGIQAEDQIHLITMPPAGEHVAPIVYTLPLQLLAYHVAVLKGTDVDQPRNLAKSVTVE